MSVLSLKEDGKVYKKVFKRLIDIVLSGIGIIVLALPMLIVSLIVVLDTPGPVFFTQRRIGLHKKKFKLIKFRSMPISAPHDVATHQLDVEKIEMTRFQKFIRRFSVDELPQMINILKGDMSIIGPRPALWNQVDLVEERDKYGANDITPGLTGWAQINGRDELEISEKAKLDGEYVKMLNESGFAADAKCFFKTIKSVLKTEGVVEGGIEALDNKNNTKKDTETV